VAEPGHDPDIVESTLRIESAKAVDDLTTGTNIHC